MQHMRRAVSAYGQAAETLAPARQIVLLYDGAIRRIREAREAIERRAFKERYLAVSKAAAIIDALHACLDHQRGGEIASNLDRLYTHFAMRLQHINLKDDPQICDELVARLGELRASWAEIAEAGASPGTAGPAAAPAGTRVTEAGTTVTI